VTNQASDAPQNVRTGEYRRIRVSPVSGSLGAEISGIDLAVDLDDNVVKEIRRAWLDHLVLFFRDQGHLTSDQYMAFARTLGTPMEYPFVHGLDGYPEITVITKLPHEKVNFGGIWHSDTTYLERPPSATMLLAREVPPAGGDTMWANQYAAFEALSPMLKSVLTTLRGVSSSAMADVSKTREDRLRDSGDPADVDKVYQSVHPVVRTHPETGRDVLYVNVAHTERFEGMSIEESRALLGYLFHHQVRPEFTCRLRWEPGTLAVWDNRCVQHNPINDYHGYLRVMNRITLEGDVPVASTNSYRPT